MRLLDKNAEIYRDMVPKIVAAAPDAVLLVATDPPDPLADLARVVAKHNRVLSTGTWLDSLRFQTHLASILRVSPASVEAQILGEHGTSEVFIWLGVRIGGVSLKQVVSARGMSVDKLREGIEGDVRYANITIIEGNEGRRSGLQRPSPEESSMRYVLIPGAGGAAWYWHRVTPLLQASGHQLRALARHPDPCGRRCRGSVLPDRIPAPRRPRTARPRARRRAGRPPLRAVPTARARRPPARPRPCRRLILEAALVEPAPGIEVLLEGDGGSLVHAGRERGVGGGFRRQ